MNVSKEVKAKKAAFAAEYAKKHPHASHREVSGAVKKQFGHGITKRTAPLRQAARTVKVPRVAQHQTALLQFIEATREEGRREALLAIHDVISDLLKRIDK